MRQYKSHPSENLEFVTVTTEVSRDFEPRPRISHSEDGTNVRATGVKLAPTKSDDELYYRIAANVPDIKHLAAESQNASQREHRMSFMQGLRMYPKAIGWSVLLSMTIVMEGYDTALINTFYAFPAFNKAYGHPTPTGEYQVTTVWQSALTNGAVVGEIVGLFFNGLLTERFGYRRTMMFALGFLALFIFLAFFAFNIGMLLASEVLCGLSWGVFQTLRYISITSSIWLNAETYLPAQPMLPRLCLSRCVRI